MAQTTTAMAGVNADVEVSTDGTTWTNISGSATSVDAPEQTRMTGTAYTFDGDIAIVTAGKREPIEITVNGLYTSTSTEIFETVRPLFQAAGGTRMYFRYSPLGIGASNRAVFTASNDGVTAGAVDITSLSYPAVDAGSGDPVATSFKVLAPCLIRTTTGTSTGLGSS